MKRNINDYKGTKTAIEVNSIEEFDKIKKLLGHKQKGINCFTERWNYISCYSDDYSNKEWWINKGFTLYKASDFLEELPKFEEGKWYKVNDKYTKFLILENESLIFGSEHIYNNKHYISELKTGTWISKLSDNPVLLTDLSEIQQYLPLNHPDLIPKENLHFYDDSGLLIKKKLIKQIEEGLDLTDRWIKCIKKCDWNDINIGEHVQIKGKGIVANVEWKNKDDYYLNLKRVEETKEFELMPEGFSPYEFKIGDYLYIIDYGIEQISPKDSVLQITNIEETYLGKWITYINIKTRWEGKFRQHHFIDNIRKATEKEILDYLSDNYHRQNPLAPKESFFTETDKMIINGFVMGNGQIFKNNIDSEDIYIIPITKRKKEIQTITIESIINLNLNLKTIKPKQIQTIKI